MSNQGKWEAWHSVALLAIIAAILAASELTQHVGWLSEHPRLTWVVCLLLLALFAVIAGHGVTGYWWGIAIDDRNRVSLSRAQMIAWVIIVSAGFLAAALLNISLDKVSALNIAIPEQLLWLMGISTTSLVGSPLISNTKKNAEVVSKRSAADARWIDMFMGEVKNDAASIDLAKVQMFFVTIVVMMAYGISVGVLLTKNVAISELPPLDGSVVGLLGISHAGYLTNKSLPKSQNPAVDPGS